MYAGGSRRGSALIRQGQAAAVALARRLGLPGDDPAVLSARGNLVIHLRPAPVVARVATLSAWSRADPMLWLSREVAVAGYVAARGGPVVPPARAVDPGPYWHSGFAISLWEHVPAVDAEASPAEIGSALARLHHAARGCPADLGDMSPLRELISEGLDTLERGNAVDAATIAALRCAHDDVLAALGSVASEPVVLHGDAHAGNLVADPRRGWLWIDLEETCRGPLAWDLATVIGRYDDAAAGRAALRGYGEAADSGLPDSADLAFFRRARMLEGAVWSLCMAQLYPARYADPAARLLAEIVGN